MGETMYTARELFFTFFIGGILYGIIEVLFRGHTHWTMVVTGGMCFMLFYIVNLRLNTNSLILRCFFSAAIITLFEFLVGYVVNIVYGLRVWDYSNQILNYRGQICLLYSSIWFAFGIPMTLLANYIKVIFV